VTRPAATARAREALSSLNRRYHLKGRALELLAVGEQFTAPLRRRRLENLQGSGERPLMVHLGCGTVALPGWVNIDVGRRSAADVHWDLRHGLPLADRSVGLYYSEHFFEHLTLAQGQRLFSDLARTLQSDGVVRIAMPDLSAVVRNYRDGTWRDVRALQDPVFASIDTPAHYINVTFREWGHLYLYDFDDLQQRLQQAGFARVERCERGRSSVAQLKDLETREESRLIVEARL
jgi:predicted SAM-dependent methyltransferase